MADEAKFALQHGAEFPFHGKPAVVRSRTCAPQGGIMAPARPPAWAWGQVFNDVLRARLAEIGEVGEG